MSVSTSDALHAKGQLDYIVSRWTDLRARLRPGGGNAMSGMPGGDGSESSPIDIGISDLIFEIEQEARLLGYVLLDETVDWSPRSSRMPVLLADVAERYGHWTAGDDRTALAFCDWAEQYQGKVRHALERPAPAAYVGPCQSKGHDGAGCGGELYLREGSVGGKCRECGQAFTWADQMAYVERELETRLMTQSEIVTALTILDLATPASTVRSWAQSGRIVEAVDGLYRLAEAKALAERRVARAG